MPIDPRSYFIQTPQMQGPLDAFKDYVSLRDMMDRRRYNDMQERRLQMQLDEAQREQQENERYRQGLMTLPSSPTLQQAVQHLGPKGINYWKAQQEAVKEGRLAESAELERDAKRGNIQKDVNERIAGLGMQAYQIADPRQREEFFNAGVAGALIDAGITPAEQFGAYRVPNNRKEAEFRYGSLTNVTKLREYLDKEAKAQREAEDYAHRTTVTRPLEEREKRATTERTEQVLAGTARPSPAAVPALFEDFYKAYLRQHPELKDSILARGAAIREWSEMNRTPMLMSPAVFQQQAALAGVKANAAAEAKGPTDAERKARGFYDRAKMADDIFTAAEETIKNMGIGDQWMLNAPEFMNSALPTNIQQLRNAMRIFGQAQLRKESGAVISDAEMNELRITLFPQAGDSEDVLKQKAKARKVVLGGFLREAGAAGKDVTPDAPPAPKMVKMRAPNGQVSEVPESMVSHYETLGAKRVQ